MMRRERALVPSGIRACFYFIFSRAVGGLRGQPALAGCGLSGIVASDVSAATIQPLSIQLALIEVMHFFSFVGFSFGRKERGNNANRCKD